MSKLCDGIRDCSDGSDEVYADDMKHLYEFGKCRYTEACFRLKSRSISLLLVNK